MEYKKTLNMPKSGFPMRAGLPAREPEMLKHWEELDLYNELLKKNEGKPLFSLHDGPPFSNGALHMGHALNKSLKDFITRMYAMRGYYTPYIPGWDNHGMPIESAIIKQNKLNHKAMSVSEFRSACHEFADHYIDVQRDGFKRMGVVGDWEHPYKTMDPGFEAQEVRVFGRMYQNGHIYKGLKPVYWCPHDETALAEAEIEYKDDPCTTVYVKFPMNDDLGKMGNLDHSKLFFVIWTTTIWTLPGNLAIALHPDESYVVVKAPNGEMYIMAEALTEKVMKVGGFDSYEILESHPGSFFENMLAQHPFLPKTSRLVLADYVTMDSGTGCVHTAPGHGADDYQAGLRYGLDILSPVDDEGRYTAEAGKYAGAQVPEVNSAIIADLRASGVLLQTEQIRHSYPHCWRCKEPVMYRATPQWFISMEKLELRQKALAAIKKVTWTPAWGQQRIYGMIEARPDWCLSRQRTWGVPLTVLTCTKCETVLQDEAVCGRIDELFRKEGADAWFKHEAADFIPEGTRCSCGASEFRKESDILDVWFDSGTSHAAVLEEREELRSPADLYLEGSDQHRGWFHSSLLTSVGTRGRAPYTGVLTHGYVVDGQGKKMSKSVGNVVAPQEVIDKYGAEVLRLWVSSENYQDDIKVSDEILKHVTDAYRKMRNTLRFLLSNLYDFDPEKDALPYDQLTDIDRWALARFAELSRRVCQAYERYEFHTVYHGLYTFCGTTISSIYLDVLKDRLYCSAPESPGRRAAQTVIHRILDGLLRLMSPILCFTSEEAWQHLYGQEEGNDFSHSVFFALQPDLADVPHDSERDMRWQRLLNLRSAITRVLETARRDKLIGLSLDAEVLLKAGPEWRQLVEENRELLQELCIVSSLRLASADDEAAFTAVEGVDDLQVAVQAAPGSKCERCWCISPSVGEDSSHPSLCSRCAAVVASVASLSGS